MLEKLKDLKVSVGQGIRVNFKKQPDCHYDLDVLQVAARHLLVLDGNRNKRSISLETHGTIVSSNGTNGIEIQK